MAFLPLPGGDSPAAALHCTLPAAHRWRLPAQVSHLSIPPTPGMGLGSSFRTGSHLGILSGVRGLEGINGIVSVGSDFLPRQVYKARGIVLN